MKLKPEYITQEVGGVQFLIGIGQNAFSGIVRSNETAAFIVDCLREETDEDTVVKAVLAEYEADEKTVRQDVRMILDKLRGIGALEE